MSRGRRPWFGPWDLAREGAANVAAGRWLAVVVVALCGVLGFAATATSLGSAQRALDEADELTVRGRYLLRYAPVVGGDVPMAFCDQLATVSGVQAAGGIGLRDRVALGNGVRVPVQEVTAGMVHLLGVHHAVDPGTVLAGSLAAERGGLRDGTWVTLPASGGRAATTAPVLVVPPSARTARLDDSVLVVVGPLGRADECWAEVDPTRKTALGTVLPGLDADDATGVAVDFNPALAELDPEADLQAVPRSPLVPVAGGAAGLLTGMWWYARRQEWVLYRVFGLGVVRRSVIATVEWALVTGVPIGVGAAWAVVAAGDADRRAVVLGWSAAGVAAAWSFLVVGLWGAISSRPRPSTVLKGG